MIEALLLKDKAGQARKGQRKMPTCALTRRRMVILDSTCSLMGVSSNKDDFKELCECKEPKYVKGAIMVKEEGEGTLFGLIPALYIPTANLEFSIMGEISLELMGHTLKTTTVKGQHYREWKNPRNGAIMQATLYDNGLYYVMINEVRKYFRNDSELEKKIANVLNVQRAKNKATPQQKKDGNAAKLCFYIRMSKILDEPDWFKARSQKERIIKLYQNVIILGEMLNPVIRNGPLRLGNTTLPSQRQ